MYYFPEDETGRSRTRSHGTELKRYMMVCRISSTSSLTPSSNLTLSSTVICSKYHYSLCSRHSFTGLWASLYHLRVATRDRWFIVDGAQVTVQSSYQLSMTPLARVELLAIQGARYVKSSVLDLRQHIPRFCLRKRRWILYGFKLNHAEFYLQFDTSYYGLWVLMLR